MRTAAGRHDAFAPGGPTLARARAQPTSHPPGTPVSQFVQWLQQAAVPELQNRHRFYRAEKRDADREVWPVAGDEDGEVADPAVTSGTASKASVWLELGVAVHVALQTLPERDRQVIQWCHVVKRARHP